jgi:beta-glucosidase
VTLRKKDFGKNFQWGTSTASYQIEGAWKKHGKGFSIWDTFTQDKSKIKDGSDGSKSTKHFKYFKKDINLLKTLNIPNYRFSISWPRILPNGTGKINEKGMDFYNRLIDRCLKKGITPWITLYHWDLPDILELKGGWTNRDILDWFANYTEIAASAFGDRVKNWIVLNEALSFTVTGYLLGYHAPGKKGLNNFIPAMHHALLCQGIGGRILKDAVYKAHVGTSINMTQVDAFSEGKRDQKACDRFDTASNRLFIEPLLGLGYPLKDLPMLKGVNRFIRDDDEKNLAFDFDFIGLQVYTREIVKYAPYIPVMKGKFVSAKERDVPHTEMGWEIYPEALYNMLHRLHSYGKIKKIIITENGASFPDELQKKQVHDPQRIDFLKSHMSQVLRAKKDGINIRGYFVWTLMDNFEWAEGYTQRFGLVYINFKNYKRYIKDSGYWLASFLK